MGEAIQAAIEFGSQILQSQFATSLLLLGAFVLLAVYTRRTIARHRGELKAALLECRRDALTDAGFLQSLMSITHSYRVLMITMTDGKRTAPHELKEIDRRFDELRKQVHDERNSRVTRLNRTLERLQEKTEQADDA